MIKGSANAQTRRPVMNNNLMALAPHNTFIVARYSMHLDLCHVSRSVANAVVSLHVQVDAVLYA